MARFVRDRSDLAGHTASILEEAAAPQGKRPASERDIAHLRAFFPDGAAEVCMERMGLR
jgi:hypothetical protein